VGKNEPDFMRDANLGVVLDEGDPNQTFNLTKQDTATGDFFYYDGDSDTGYDDTSDSGSVGWTFNGSSSGTINLFGGAAQINFGQDGSWTFSVVDSGLLDFTGGPISTTVTVDAFGSVVNNEDVSDSLTFNMVCYCTGAEILCVDGYRPIEALKVGHRVVTPDGPEPVVWTGYRRIDAARLSQKPELAPIELPKDSLGPDTPNKTLRVSPQHRIVLSSAIVTRMFGEKEILVPAKKLCASLSCSRKNVGRRSVLRWLAKSSSGASVIRGLRPEGPYRRQPMSWRQLCWAGMDRH